MLKSTFHEILKEFIEKSIFPDLCAMHSILLILFFKSYSNIFEIMT